MEQLKTFLKKYKIWVIAVVVLAVVGFAAKTAIDYHNNNLVSKVEVKFSGYDGEGTAEFKNNKKFYNDISLKILKLNGFKDNIAKEMVSESSNFDSSVLSDTDLQKVSDANSEIESVKVRFNKSEHLKNGDKITVQAKNFDPDRLPFRSGKKVVTVKGLKKPKKVPAKYVFDRLKLKSVGTNGKGILSVVTKTENDYDTFFRDVSVKVKNNGSLSNGDTVKIKLPSSSFITDYGKYKYVGSHTFSYKVSGLLESTSVSNIDDVVSAVNKIAIGDSPDDSAPKLKRIYLLPYTSDEYTETDSSLEASRSVEINDVPLDYKWKIIAYYDEVDDETQAAEIKNVTFKDGKLKFDAEADGSPFIANLSDPKTWESTGLKIK